MLPSLLAISHRISHRIYYRNSVRLSVRVSVRPSVCHTRELCPHGSTYTIMISSPYDSPIILVSGDIKFIPKFEGDHPSEGVE